MRSLGSLFLMFGVISALLKLLMPGVVLLPLMWVDNWGPEIGWSIRIAFIAVGVILMALGTKKAVEKP